MMGNSCLLINTLQDVFKNKINCLAGYAQHSIQAQNGNF